MSVVRGRPPGLAGGISGASRAYCSSLKACPAPKSPTSARLSIVHMACLQEGLFPPEPPGSSAGTAAHPNEVGFSNGLSAPRPLVVAAQPDLGGLAAELDGAVGACEARADLLP